MCWKRMVTFASCAARPHNHHYHQGFVRCPVSLNRPNRAYCLPATGNLRDLPQLLDVQDRELTGDCPICKGITPPSSAGSN